MEVPERGAREKGREIIWKNNGQNFQNFDERHGYKYPKYQTKPCRIKSETHIKTHCNKKCQRKSTKSIFKLAQEGSYTRDHIQGIFNNVSSIFLIRNFGDQKKVGWYSQSSKRKKYIYIYVYIHTQTHRSTKNLIFSKTVLQSAKLRHQIHKIWGSITTIPAPQEMPRWFL